jgi:RNA polymerase sigma-70 factor (ECF subfamily)
VDDRDLVARARAGDGAAERALYDRHVDRVYRLAYRMTGDGDRAQEFTQDAFVRVFEKLHTYRGDAAFSTWVHAIATSVVLNGLRRMKRFKRETDLEAAEAVATPGRTAEPDLKERLRRAIDALADGYRAVFVMHDVEGYTHEEIAAALGIEVGTSKAQLSRARARLRTALSEFAGEWA